MNTYIILSICTGSVFLLAYILILNPGKANPAANRWLGIFVFCFGLALLTDLLRMLDISSQYPAVVVFSEITRFAAAPSLYLSICYFTIPDRSFRKKDVLHFIPLFLFFINCIPLLISGFSQPMISNQFDSMGAGEYIRVFMFLIIKVQVVTYWILSFTKLNHHRKNMTMVFSSLAPVDLTWLKYFLLSLLLVLFIWFNEAFSGIKWINDYNALGYLLAIYGLSYFALKQKEIFPFESSEVADLNEIIKETNEYSTKKERIAAEQLESLKIKLKHLMEQDKCFLDPDLGLPHLAEKMNLTSHELSYLLNQGLSISFFEFVNRYRIEEAKQLLLSNEFQHLNILRIAYETGFNSKTTFNTAFKKFTGMSPSEFKKSPGGSHPELLASSSPT